MTTPEPHNPPAAPLKVLVVDDEASIRKVMSLALQMEGHEVTAVTTPSEALEAVDGATFDLAFVDIRLGEESGLDLLQQLRERAPWTSVVIITAHGTVESAVEAMRQGASDFLTKPFTPSQIALVAERVARVSSMERRIQELEQQVQAGSPPPGAARDTRNAAMKTVYDTAMRVAESDATILIRGESGTGKTVLARAVHEASRRRTKPFAVVSCPSIPEQLLEGELFGHTKGAFTGAVRDNPGRIAAAQGGTLFLDEIGDMPLGLQAKILRFLQDREYERLGDSATRRADVRIIAATNVDLEARVRDGQFREDLFYRLNVIEIVMPPLRERPEDILPLAEAMFRVLCTEHGRRMEGFTAEAAATLQSYGWPGNLRELRNAIERGVLLSPGRQVGVDALPIRVTQSAAGGPAETSLMSLEKLEEIHIRRVLAATETLDDAAHILGIDLATLYRRRKKYGLA